MQLSELVHWLPTLPSIQAQHIESRPENFATHSVNNDVLWQPFHILVTCFNCRPEKLLIRKRLEMRRNSSSVSPFWYSQTYEKTETHPWTWSQYRFVESLCRDKHKLIVKDMLPLHMMMHWNPTGRKKWGSVKTMCNTGRVWPDASKILKSRRTVTSDCLPLRDIAPSRNFVTQFKRTHQRVLQNTRLGKLKARIQSHAYWKYIEPAQTDWKALIVFAR